LTESGDALATMIEVEDYTSVGLALKCLIQVKYGAPEL
jgi:hypothetical protein